MENFFKGITNGSGISCKPPKEYMERFTNFSEKVFMKKENEKIEEIKENKKTLTPISPIPGVSPPGLAWLGLDMPDLAWLARLWPSGLAWGLS